MNKHKISYFRLGMFLISLTFLLTGCSEDVEISDPTTANRIQPEQAEVEISLSLGADWNVDCDDETRSAPPGIDGNNDTSNPVDGSAEYGNVDKVRIFTFRRRDPEVANVVYDDDDYDSSFIYDASNDRVFDIEKIGTGSDDDALATTPAHNHKIAHGLLNKVYGYEYRVLAIAYSSTRSSDFANVNKSKASKFIMPQGEHNWFTLKTYDGLRLSDFKASVVTYTLTNKEASWKDFIAGHTSGGYSGKNYDILSMKSVDMPQLFFGECYTTFNGKKSEIIKYYETDLEGTLQKDLDVSGILYRGMAKVELQITPTQHMVGVLTYNVTWIALMADNVYTEVGLSDYDDFLSPFTPIEPTNKGKGVFTPIAYCNVASKECDGNTTKTLTAYMLPCKTRLAVRIKTTNSNTIRNALLTADDVTSTGNGTGIISPDLINDYFYLRRNHKYVLKVTDSELLLTNHKL